MPKIKKITTSSNDSKYVEFLSTIKLIALGLKVCTAKLDRQMLYKINDEAVRKMSDTYAKTEIGDSYFEAEGRFKVTIAAGDRVGLSIDCTFEVHLHATPTIDPTLVERFAKQDLRFILIPYARSFISDMTSRMHIPPVHLPLAAAGMARPRK